jgi:hypothetical protein
VGLALAALLQLALASPAPGATCQADASASNERRLARQAEAPANNERRLVAVGDVHGNHDGFVAILRRAALIDESNRWIGGSATLVQTGDVTDRGLGVAQTLDLLMALERDARRGGGRVVPLAGNHEVMNLLGDTRDVNPEIYATFADEKSDARRDAAWTSYARMAETQKSAAGEIPPPYNQTQDAWMAAHPRGYLEYREAFRPRGRYGAWLRDRDIAASVGGAIFMHAGPPIAPSTRPVDDLNVTARREIARFDRFVQTLVDRKLALPSFTLNQILEAASNQIKIAIAFIDAQRNDREAPRPTLGLDELREAEAVLDIGNWSLLAAQGPLWIRGYATWPDTERDKVAAVLKAYGATRLVIAHTPQPGRIAQRFSGLVYLIDTGMLASVYKGVPSALEIVGSRVTAIYLDSQEVLTPQ